VALLVGGSLWVAGCGKSSQLPSKTDAERPGRTDVVARIDNTTITVGRLEDELNRLHPSIRVRFTSPERRKEFLQNLVNFEALANEAKRRGLDRDPEVVKRVKRAMIDVMMNEIRSTLLKPGEITDKDVERYYNEHLSRYQQPPKVRGSLLEVKTQAEAQRLLAQLKKGKPGDTRAFAELVVKHSIDPATKVKRGDLGFFGRKETTIPPQIVQATFAISGMWDYSPPFKTAEGWAIVMKTGDIAEMNRPLVMERDRIRNQLFNERRTQKVDQFVKDLQARAKVQVLDQNLAKVQVKDTPQPPSSFMPQPPHHGPPGGHPGASPGSPSPR